MATWNPRGEIVVPQADLDTLTKRATDAEVNATTATTAIATLTAENAALTGANAKLTAEITAIKAAMAPAEKP